MRQTVRPRRTIAVGRWRRDPGGVFDLDEFVSDCITARQERDSMRAVKEVLERATARGTGVDAALPPDRAGIRRLHVSPELTVINVVWAPDMTIRPHDHRMWAAIGIYSGGEDNTFYRRGGEGIVESGGKKLRVGDVCLLGDDTIHSVHNPTAEFAGTIHVYGGDFFTMPRSEWDTETYAEKPYDVEFTLRAFEESNRRFGL
jgi:predicted metal-dependent enzyme (double-stranded beta helix superfamily)